MRIALFGQGPLMTAVQSVLQGHATDGPFVSPQDWADPTATQADVGLSAGYRHIFKPADWQRFPNGILNLHTGFLPWNRGAYPNVWPILDGSPAGVTLHRVDKGLDTGPIIAQQEVPVEPWDTAKTLYDKLVSAGATLVAEQVYRAESFGWPDGIPQLAGEGSFHKKSAFPNTPHDEYQSTKYREGLAFRNTLRYLRAHTFPGYGFRYWQDGKLIEATITLKEVTE